MPAPASQPVPAPARDTITTLTLLPVADAHVDPGHPAESFPGKSLLVSSSDNKSQQVGYLMFDLTAIPPGATVTTCQLVLTVDGPVSKQIVKVVLVDDDTWTDRMTFQTAPAPSKTPVGTWLAEGTSRVATNAVNPVLVATVRDRRAGPGRRLSVQISSVFGQEGGATSNSYFSFESAAVPGSAPRLVIRYRPAAAPLARDWPQPQADSRHSGRSAWRFAGTPTHTYLADTVVSGMPLASPAVVVNDLLYFFTPTTLQVLNPAGKTRTQLVFGLNAFGTSALAPGGLLYAAAAAELAAFDLTAGGNKTISVPLKGASEITAGADGSVYLVQGTALYAYVRRLDTLAPSWSKELGTGVHSPVTLSADGSIAFIATENRLHALLAADGSEAWTYRLPSAAAHLTIPVCGRENGLSYFGVDDALYVFGAIAKPLCMFREVAGVGISQPVIDDGDVLHALQSGTLFTVSADGMTITGKATVPDLDASTPVRPAMDGAGNVFIIDNNDKLYVCSPDLTVANQPQQVPFTERMQSLQIAPDGSLFCGSASALFRLTPAASPTVTVDAYQDATCYRARSSLVLDGAALPVPASVLFQSGGSIAIRPGFSVPRGTEAVFITGH
jgi:outer membrane protein assembly factor BamB